MNWLIWIIAIAVVLILAVTIGWLKFEVKTPRTIKFLDDATANELSSQLTPYERVEMLRAG